MNRALVDTDILSYFLKGNQKVAKNFQLYLNEYPKITISEITYFEVLAGLTFKKAVKQIEGLSHSFQHVRSSNSQLLRSEHLQTFTLNSENKG